MSLMNIYLVFVDKCMDQWEGIVPRRNIYQSIYTIYSYYL
jgi:hypothetical protein